MAKLTYLKNPGYAIDLIYAFNLYFNKEYCSVEHVNRDKLYSDVDFYKSITSKFSPINDEFAPFFRYRGNEPDFITAKYLLAPVSNPDEISLDSIIARLSDKQLFLANISDYYFGDYSQYPLGEMSAKIAALNVSDAIKHRLLSFYISPDLVIGRLIAELKVKESTLRRYYEENFEELMKLQSSIDAEALCEHFALDAGGEYAYTICLLNKNLLAAMHAGAGELLTLGSDYQDAIMNARNYSERPDMVKFGKILSEENRLKIIEMINQRYEMCTSDIAKNLSSSATVIYYHLEMMSEAKLLNARSEGRTVYYSLNRDYFKMCIEDLQKYLAN